MQVPSLSRGCEIAQFFVRHTAREHTRSLLYSMTFICTLFNWHLMQPSATSPLFSTISISNISTKLSTTNPPCSSCYHLVSRSCELDRHIVLSSSCEFDRHIGMLSSSEFYRHIGMSSSYCESVHSQTRTLRAHLHAFILLLRLTHHYAWRRSYTPFNGWHARSLTRLVCTLFNTASMHAL
jgi:hypothetical protein